jgi:hypothetical protein
MPTKFADGSGVPSPRVDSAFVRATEACLRVSRAADRLANELDHVTIPGSGVVHAPLDENDSLVVAVREAREAASRLPGT